MKKRCWLGGSPSLISFNSNDKSHLVRFLVQYLNVARYIVVELELEYCVLRMYCTSKYLNYPDNWRIVNCKQVNLTTTTMRSFVPRLLRSLGVHWAAG